MALIEADSVVDARPVSDSPRPYIVAGALFLVLVFGVMVAWAVLGRISSASGAPGVIAVEGSRKAVQHREGGPVGAILVKEGDFVRKGQVLIRLDLSEVAAEVQVLTSQRVQTLVRLSRLRAEAAGRETIDFPADVEALRRVPEFSALFSQEEALFEARRGAFEGNSKLLVQQIEGYERRIEGLQGKAKSTRDQLALIRQELTSLLVLLKKGYVERSRVLALQRAEAGLIGDLESMAADVATTDNEIAKSRLQIAQMEKERREAIAKDLNEAESLISQIEPRLDSARDRLKRAELLAPEDGYVYGMKIHSLGATVTPSDTVLEIVPASEPLVVKAKINPDDIDRVTAGQDVEIHLQAYHQRFMSIIWGKLTKISPDAFQDPATREAWFEGTVVINPEDLARNGALLVPGMAVTTQIYTGERTIAAYFLDPFYHLYDFAMKED